MADTIQDQKESVVIVGDFECGCEIGEITPAKKHLDLRLRWCPLHAKAQEMREMLNAIPESISIDNVELYLFCNYCNRIGVGRGDIDHDTSCIWTNAQALLRDIEGETE